MLDSCPILRKVERWAGACGMARKALFLACFLEFKQLGFRGMIGSGTMAGLTSYFGKLLGPKRRIATLGFEADGMATDAVRVSVVFDGL